MVFQIDSICSQETDEAILAALKDLPKDLPDTFNRILRKLQHSNATAPRFCRKIFDLVAAAQRPLTLEELREAVSVKPGETTWDTSKLVNDMLRVLSDSCGSLVAVDEEHLTVHFAHHSVKQHLLSEPIESDIRKYHINMDEADLYLGDIIVTYLNFGIFDRELTKTNTTINYTMNSTMLPEVVNYPSAILSSLPRSNLANRLALRFLKSKRDRGLDIPIQYQTAAKTVYEPKDQAQRDHSFLMYAQEYWLFHTKMFKPARAAGYDLWQRLINNEVKIIELPWAPEKWHQFGDEYMKWIIENKHWALINQSLDTFSENESSPDKEAILLLEFLEKRIEMNFQNINLTAALIVATYLNNEVVVLLLVRNGADVNAGGGYYGNSLQAASVFAHEGIAKLLLENGADVNALGGYYGNALQAASIRGHERIARLLLENGVIVNTSSEYHGNALQAASKEGHEAIAKLLLENGADVNASGGYCGNALQAASKGGHKAIAKLLLENGADVNASGGYYGNALQAASTSGHEEIVRLLLENGADVNGKGGYYGNALQAASRYGHERIVRLLLENGANVNAEGGTYGNALQAASTSAHEEIVRLLLENGINVNAEGGTYGNALQAASASGHEEIVRWLLDNGADVNAEGGSYGNALQAASGYGHEKIVRLLLENGADVDERPTSQSSTPISVPERDIIDEPSTCTK